MRISWHLSCYSQGVTNEGKLVLWPKAEEPPAPKSSVLKFAKWARAEQARKAWGEWRADFFAQVRLTFIMLLLGAIYVFISNHQLEIQYATSNDMHVAFKHVKLPDKLRQKALNYQKEVDSASDFSSDNKGQGE